MRLGPVTRFVAYALLAVGAMMILPALMNWAATGETPGSYIAGAFFCFGLSALCLAVGLGSARRPVVRAGMRELLLALMIFWGLIPVAASVPFLFSGFSLDEAWFEAVSALTTTGAWLSDSGAAASGADMIYRASLEWLGGLISIATAGAVFVRPEFIGVAPLVPPFSRGESGSFIRAFDRAVWTFLPIYTGITAAGLFAFVLAGVPVVEAATMALSFIATGGFVPAEQGMAAYSPPAIIIAMLLMGTGAINFIVISRLILGRQSTMRLGSDEETAAFVILIPCVTLLYWISIGAGDLDRLVPQMFNAVSILSTSGVVIGDAPALVPVLVTAVIGGAAVSTAGGIKLLRWLVTIRRTNEELWKLTHPGGVRGRKPHVNEIGIWAHALAFTILMAAIVLISALFGNALDVSAAVTVAAVANAGPLVDLAPLTTADYEVFDPLLRGVLGIAMIAGRLELVALMVMLSRRFWVG